MVTYHFGIKWHFLQSFSVSSLSSWDLVLIPSLMICNKLSNEWSAVFVAQLLLVELKKICQKSWRTWVRPDISSTFCRFELMSGQTNVLTPSLAPLISMVFCGKNEYIMAQIHDEKFFLWWPQLLAHNAPVYFICCYLAANCSKIYFMRGKGSSKICIVYIVELQSLA